MYSIGKKIFNTLTCSPRKKRLDFGNNPDSDNNATILISNIIALLQCRQVVTSDVCWRRVRALARILYH